MIPLGEESLEDLKKMALDEGYERNEIHLFVEEYLENRYDFFSKLAENILPHGSGIDCDWTWELQNNLRVIYRNSFHGMTQHGYYDGYADFWIRFSLDNPEDFELHFTDPPKGRSWFWGLREYLEDTLSYSLECLDYCVGLPVSYRVFTGEYKSDGHIVKKGKISSIDKWRLTAEVEDESGEIVLSTGLWRLW